MTTYILPQSAGTPGPGQVIINQSGAPQTPTAAAATLIQSTATSTHNTSHNPSTNSSNATGRRYSPPSNHHHSSNNGHRDHNSSSVSTPVTMHATAVPLQTFPSSVPLPTEAAGQASGPQTIYALPPSMYPNVLPYQTTAGFYQPISHPPANTTIISSVIPHTNAHPTPPVQHPPPTLPSTPHSYQSNAGTHITTTGEIVTTHFPFTPQASTHQSIAANNATSTPQSTPSTPITVQPNFKNPPLFATPPIIASVTTSAHNDSNKGTPNASGGSTYAPKKFNNGNSAVHTPPPSSTKSNMNPRHSVGGGYQGNNSTLGNAQGKKSINYNNPTNPNNNNSSNNNSNNTNSSNSSSEDTSSLTLSNSSNNYRAKNRDQSSAGSNYPPKPSSYVPKGQQSQQHNYSNSQSPNSNDNSEQSKYVHRGPNRSVPPSLDLKRNNSNTNFMTNNYHHNRSTPSTNSTESNNSPNSITSYDHSRNFHYSHNPATAHFIRGGSAGPGGNNNPNDAPMPTCFPFSVQNPGGASAQLIDPCQNQALIGYNNTMTAGMYVKLGPAITYANVSDSLSILQDNKLTLIYECFQPIPNSRKSPSNDMRPYPGIYTMAMLPGK